MASQMIGSLFVKLGLNSAEFGSGLGKAEKRMQNFSRIAGVAMAAAAAAAAVGISRMTSAGLKSVDAQAKLAQSLGTTQRSIATLERAGDLAGVSMGTVEQGVIALTRRLSEAAGGTGPAVDALARLKLSAEDLGNLEVDDRIAKIQDAIAKYIPEAERASVASKLFGDRAGVMFARIDGETLRTAAKDVADFGLAVTEVEADQIERTNDALSRLGLIGKGTATTFAAALAPALEAFADAMAAVARNMGPVRDAIRAFGENIGRIATYAATAAAIFGGKLAAGLALAALRTISLSGALVVLRGALIRTGIGAIIVLAGELVYRFTQLVKGAGGFGEALGLLKDVSIEAFGRMGEAGDFLSASLGFTFKTIEAGWSLMVANMQKIYADFLHAAAASARSIPFLSGVADDLGAAAIMAGSKMYEMNLATDGARDAAHEYAVAMQASAAAMTAPLETMEALRAALKAAGDETDNTGASIEDLQDKLAGLNGLAAGGGALAGVKDAAKAAAGEVQTFGEAIQQSLESSLSGAFNGLLDGTKSIRSALADIFGDLARMAANSLIKSLLAGAFGGGGGGLGALFGMPAFASGTNFAPGGMALVGERGPELVNLPRGSQVIPNDKIGAPAGGATRIINVLDPSIVGDYLNTSAGERLIINKMNKAGA